MSDEDRPQLYLLTPPDLSLASFPDRLAKVLDAVEVACLRLRLASDDETEVARTADCLREVAHARDVPIVIDSHVALVTKLGLDGVHLRDGQTPLRKLRQDLGGDAIIGAYCGNSRHDGMNAGEAGADYVSFGPVGQTSLGSGDVAAPELFAWWSEMIELPVVAEGALDEEVVSNLCSVTDFFAFGDEIWRSEDPVASLKTFIKAMG